MVFPFSFLIKLYDQSLTVKKENVTFKKFGKTNALSITNNSFSADRTSNNHLDVFRTRLQVDSGGSVIWNNLVTWKSSCNLDITWFPVDKHVSFFFNSLEMLYSTAKSGQI